MRLPAFVTNHCNYDSLDRKWDVASAKFEVTTGCPGRNIQESVRKGGEPNKPGQEKGKRLAVSGRTQRTACERVARSSLGSLRVF